MEAEERAKQASLADSGGKPPHSTWAEERLGAENVTRGL
jgi:hypothetical protein